VFADARSGNLHLVNDRFGARPCYVLRAPHAVYFSSNVRFLLHLARERYRPDVQGWLEVFTCGHTVGTRTTLASVRRLRPGTHLTLTPAADHERRYWRLEHQPDPGLDPGKHSSAVFEAFRAGAERRARLVGEGVVAVSGGLDSRLLAGALGKRHGFSAFTFLDGGRHIRSADADAAAAVCAALGLRHQVQRLETAFTRPSDVVSLTGGMRPYHHMAIAMAYVEEVRRNGTRFLLGGGPGDSLAGAFIPSPTYVDPDQIAQSIRDACRVRLARSRHWRLIFRDDVIATARKPVEEALVASFEEVGGPTAAHRVTAWAMAQRQAAFTLTSVFHTHPDVAEAFCHLDYRYADLMLQLPAAWLYGKAFYTFMVYRELPELRHIPYANTGLRLTGELPTLGWASEPLGSAMHSRARVLARRLGARHARRVFTSLGRPRPSRRRRDVLHDDVLLATIQQIVHSVPSLEAMLDIERCDEFLAGVRTGRFDAGGYDDVLGTLASICISAATLP
jgi:hypothetical protein